MKVLVRIYDFPPHNARLSTPRHYRPVNLAKFLWLSGLVTVSLKFNFLLKNYVRTRKSTESCIYFELIQVTLTKLGSVIFVIS
jgi:hypothetical protein